MPQLPRLLAGIPGTGPTWRGNRRARAGNATLQAVPLVALMSVYGPGSLTTPLALLCNSESCLRCNAVRKREINHNDLLTFLYPK